MIRNLSQFSTFITIITLLLGCNISKTTLDSSSSQLENDCYPDRSVDFTFTDQPATIIKVTDRYLLSTQQSKRFLPCNIPEQYKTEGLAVIFSGQRLLTFPNERLIGTPLLLSKLSSTSR